MAISHQRGGLLLALVLLASLVPLIAAPHADAASPFARVSVAADGSAQSGGGGETIYNPLPVVSDDGRYAAFTTSATNMIGGNDTNGVADVFVRDRDTDDDDVFDDPGQATTIRVSVSSAGVESNGSSQDPVMSPNGRFIAFTSLASNLVTGDTNGKRDVFVHDRDTDEDGTFDEPGQIDTARVNVTAAGAQGSFHAEWGGFNTLDISSDGRYVAFVTPDAFDDADTPCPYSNGIGCADVYVRDRDKDTDGIFDETGGGESATTVMSTTESGVLGNYVSTEVSMSANGRYVALSTNANDIPPRDGTGNHENLIYVRDRDADIDGAMDEAGQFSMTLASVNSAGSYKEAFGPSITNNGNIVAFHSSSALVPDDTNSSPDVYSRNISSGTTDRESLSDSGAQGDYWAGINPHISGDGEFITFISGASNFHPDGNPGNADWLYLRDRTTGLNQLVARNSRGFPTTDGRFVGFSVFEKLVAEDTDTRVDAYVYDRGEGASGTVSDGGTVTTLDGAEATSGDPVETSVTVPSGVSGEVSINESLTVDEAATGWNLFGQQINISAPAGTANDPLSLVFRLDSSLIPQGQTINDIEIFRNGAKVPDCTGAPGTADPNPCLAGKVTDGDDLVFTVRTVAASAWNFGVLDNSKPTAGVSSMSSFQLAKSFGVSWTGSDTGSGIKEFILQKRTMPNSFVSWKTTAATSEVFAGTPGATYCFRAKTRDRAGNVSQAWSSSRCTALPFDDRALTASGNWAKKTDALSYLDTYRQSSHKSASLSKTVTGKRLALIATKCPGCGKVVITFAGKRVKEVSLAATTTQRAVVIPITTFGQVKKGTLKATISTSRKPVKIDGFGASRA